MPPAHDCAGGRPSRLTPENFRGVCIYPLFTCQGSRRRTPTPNRLAFKAEPTAGPGLEPGAPGLQPSALPTKRTSVLSAHMLRRCLNYRGWTRTSDFLHVREALYQLNYAASLAHRSRWRYVTTCPPETVRHFRVVNGGGGIRTRGLRNMNPARTPLLYTASVVNHDGWA